MAKYYVTDVLVNFPDYTSDCTSTCGRFIWRLDVFGIANCILNETTAGFFANHVGKSLSRITVQAGSRPTYSTKTINNQINTINYESKTPYILAGQMRTYLESQRWVETGWTGGSNETNFKTEMATYFNTSKAVTTGGSTWGSDNGTDILFFKVTFTNDAGKTYYFPIYYHGNYGTEITV